MLPESLGDGHRRNPKVRHFDHPCLVPIAQAIWAAIRAFNADEIKRVFAMVRCPSVADCRHPMPHLVSNAERSKARCDLEANRAAPVASGAGNRLRYCSARGNASNKNCLGSLNQKPLTILDF